MSVAAIERYISAAISDGLVEAPCRRLLCGKGLLVNPAHLRVTKSAIKVDRRLDVTHMDADIRHAHDLGLLGNLGAPQGRALLKLEVDPVGVAHENKTVARSTIGLANKCHALAFEQRVSDIKSPVIRVT